MIYVINPSKVLAFFFIAGVLLIPFGALPYFQGSLGEITVEGYFYPSLIGVILYMFFIVCQKGDFRAPKDIIFTLFLVWIGVVFISGIVNLPVIHESLRAEKSGMARFLEQFAAVIFYACLLCFYYDVLRRQKDVIEFIFKLINFGFYFSAVYAAFEIAAFLGYGFGAAMINSIGPLVRGEFLNAGRVMSLSYEPSCLGVYIGFIFPWFVGFHLILGKNKIGMFAIFYMLMMVLLSASRTAYFIIAVETFLFMALFFRLLRARQILYVAGGCGLLCVSLYYFYEISDVGRNWISILDVLFSLSGQVDGFQVSNISRFALQTSAYRIFQDYPLLGIGFGQFAFQFADYMPDWGYLSPEMYEWTRNGPDAPWTGAFNLYLRILAETGLLGCGLWIGMWVILLYRLFCCLAMANEKEAAMLKIMMISIIGVLMGGLNFDTYRFPAYWLMLALGIVTTQRFKGR